VGAFEGEMGVTIKGDVEFDGEVRAWAAVKGVAGPKFMPGPEGLAGWRRAVMSVEARR